MPALIEVGYNRSTDITPSNTVNLPIYIQNQRLTDAIYAGGAGTITVVYEDGSTQQFTAIVGTILQVRAKRVNLTGTAATPLVALYIN